MSLAVTARDADALDIVNTSVSGLPPGVTFTFAAGSANGRRVVEIIFQGAPTATGISTVVITATDNHGATATVSFEWLVVEPGQGDLEVSATATGGDNRVMFTVEIVNRGPADVTNATVAITEPPNLVQPLPGARALDLHAEFDHLLRTDNRRSGQPDAEHLPHACPRLLCSAPR